MNGFEKIRIIRWNAFVLDDEGQDNNNYYYNADGDGSSEQSD